MQPAALAAATSASVVPDTVLIDISVKAASPVEAKDLTDAMTAELISDIRLLESRSGLGVSVVEPVVTAPAVVPKAPSEPNITIYLLLGAAGGFLIGITAASRLLRRSVDSSQVEQVTGSPVLGIPNSGVVDSGGTADDALSTAEVLSRQWENIQKRVKFELGESDGAVLVVTTEDGSGRSSASASELGRAFAIAGSRALLVGTQTVANVDHLSGQPGAPGLAEVIAGESQLQDAIRPADDENLFLIAGPPAGVAAPLLQSEKFRENVGRMREAFDFVLFDSSAFLKQTEPNLLTELADAVILVMAETDVNRRELTAALRSIRERGMRLLGSILTSDSPADTGSGTRRTFVTSNGRA
jgi:receptor protein-tyrosine kinase